MEYLYDKLKKYKEQEIYPMHMPGHKRNLELMGKMDPYSIDITEIDGFDNLHDAQEILKEQMEEAAKLYGSMHTHYLINGSTSGLLVAIAACTKKGDTVLVARNCHKAVYHGIFLQELVPIYLYPNVDEKYGIQREITPEQVKEQLEKNPEIKMVLLTSPTYEGVVSDIAAIADVVHAYHIPLVVDEAHGAHLGFHSAFPNNSVACGADLVIHSVHKTLPAFTQTALLHSNGELVDYDKVKMYLQIFQTSSPSYVLMAGISNCLRLVREQGMSLFDRYVERLTWFYQQCEKLEALQVYMPWKEQRTNQPYAFDPSKIVIFTQYSELTGVELYDLLLHKYQIQCEMVSKNYVLAMTSIADTEEGFHRLVKALFAIDESLTKKGSRSEINTDSLFYVTNLMLVRTPYEAYNLKRESISLDQSVGRVAGEQIYLYPPGIPLIVPGEQITEEVITTIQEYQAAGLQIKGMQDGKAKTILVVGEEKNG
ncbi:aminotransferase class I/II-fold pyridoxal phosphate-dependent enzyme [Anaerosporobacter faecicola]|uniref:aminotransferase class I/II-fold pyridoxal phosphate-dependent enzyme n=1 Tax=Anaerosporobacter faecicola TaxID=2718714 RepID=UPI0014388EF3|nr:aminotransferase class I/II-fold pyridoxal phosphate-dependent enzyme [Anaerosporobacter faecicola]